MTEKVCVRERERGEDEVTVMQKERKQERKIDNME